MKCFSVLWNERKIQKTWLKRGGIKAKGQSIKASRCLLVNPTDTLIKNFGISRDLGRNDDDNVECVKLKIETHSCKSDLLQPLSSQASRDYAY